MKIPHGIRAKAVTGYDRRYEDHHFDSSVKAIELVDYEGTVQAPFEVAGPNAFGVYYTAATSFYRAFANTKFDAPIIFDIGEYPAEEFTPSGDAITDVRVNMAQCFRNSDLSILPHGGSRELISNLNNCFDGCRKLRHWMPQDMVAAGLAGSRDPEAPRILRSNGTAEHAFLTNLKPETMRYMFKDCVMYDGTGINSIGWQNLKDERAAEGFAEGCTFAPQFLNAIVDHLWWQAVHQKKVATRLNGVNLGRGHLTGQSATHYHELREHGIEVIVES